MDRTYNFNPGPAALPLEVLEQGRDSFMEYGGQGMSLMEMSHRSKPVERMIAETEELLLELIGLADAGYRVLFMSGGASAQFALAAMNLLTAGKSGRYVLSGGFSEKAYEEALSVGEAEVLASGKSHGWARLPDVDAALPGLTAADTAYVHLTTNNTIEGSQFRRFPDTGAIPLIGDMTSDILSRELDWKRFAMFYAGAQKNLGPAGVTAVVIREDLLAASAGAKLPAIFRYATYAANNSLYNTPPVHSIYMMKLMLEWTARQGGVAAMEARSAEKAALLYEAIDASGGFYGGIVERPYRSSMNATWRLSDESLERTFLQEAQAAGFAGLAGHRSVGGIRASIYNGVPVEACRALAGFMHDFRKRRG
ncbi:3-phosphoserine/phosphohydroxythreonine transaminase [Cohnella sp. JJ-181]|uniref:3-phosphoserine/phosphohydroxythreonine transaminase n=1 Tax=Cohnella rhizoplanae TaxID=2974897 RepID=UPI0022FF9FBA|nr:3-phosphoserine/phosphohydroxythreonine transaminase [Cohnella sp. JJ-181]CAI6075188.1 Phosphoserine aminotransferase [Cohnella sp. JJ-181]